MRKYFDSECAFSLIPDLEIVQEEDEKIPAVATQDVDEIQLKILLPWRTEKTTASVNCSMENVALKGLQRRNKKKSGKTVIIFQFY